MMLNDDSQEPSTCSKSIDDDDSDEESNHEQWGNFDEQQPTTSRPKKRAATKMLTAGERDLLKEEFLGIMYSNFLSGRDTEFFDYSTVDANEEYDDSVEQDQDLEDKYFEEDSQDPPAIQANNDTDSDDDLDIYMKQLEKNLQQQNTSNDFQEEFDE